VNNAEQQAPPIKRAIANLIYRWPDVPMPLVYQVPMPIIEELFALGLVALVGDQKDTFSWVGKSRTIVCPDVPAERVNMTIEITSRRDDPLLDVIKPLINSAESIKFEQTKGSRQQYEKITPTLYTTIEITNHGPTSEHPKPLEG